jgi:hypothetical protein
MRFDSRFLSQHRGTSFPALSASLSLSFPFLHPHAFSLVLDSSLAPSRRLADPCLMHLQGTWAGTVEFTEA